MKLTIKRIISSQTTDEKRIQLAIDYGEIVTWYESADGALANSQAQLRSASRRLLCALLGRKPTEQGTDKVMDV